MPDLLAITTLTNLLALSLTLWLGLYIILRSPRSRLSQLAALALWSGASYFLCNALMLNLPEHTLLSYLRQLVLIVVPVWYHLSVLLSSRKTRPVELTARSRVLIAASYAGALVLILLGVLPSDPPVGVGAWLYALPAGIGPQGFMGRAFNPLYPLFLFYLVTFGILSVVNLWQLARSSEDALRRSLRLIFLCTSIALAGALYSSLGSFLRLDLPTLSIELAYALAILSLGFAVARYDALLGGRPLERDFVSSLAVVGSLTLVYALVIAALFWRGEISFLASVVVLITAVIASSIFDQVQVILDRLLYRKPLRELRGNLRQLASEAGTGQPLHEHLGSTLGAVIRALDVERGIIACREGELWVVRATHDSFPVEHTFSLPMLTADETQVLASCPRDGLGNLAVLCPMFMDDCQIGAMALGYKRSGKGLTLPEIELVEDLGVHIANAIHAHALQEENAAHIGSLVADFRERERALQLQFQQLLERGSEEKPPESALVEERMVQLVEDGLRRLQDYDYLGEQELARLRVVTRRVESDSSRVTTFIDTGKALSQVLVEAISRLKPEGKEPSKLTIPTREWHPYIILHDAYVLGEPNRNIMGRLYISQGTFNRTRRRALRAVAKALAEMEQASKGESALEARSQT